MAEERIIPRARRDDLVVERVGEETLVYDLRTDRAHCLNQSAAFVWDMADGRTSCEEILERIRGAVDPQATPEVVSYALDRLDKARLLDRQYKRAGSPVTRRQLMRASVVAIPLITSLIAPTVAMAQSGITALQCAASGGAYGHNKTCCIDVGRKCRANRKSYTCTGGKC
jgi:hypothetical protein